MSGIIYEHVQLEVCMQFLDRQFAEFKQHGEYLIREGLLTSKDIDDYKSNTVANRIISIGVPAYCILEALLRSANANSDGLLLSKSIYIYIYLFNFLVSFFL